MRKYINSEGTIAKLEVKLDNSQKRYFLQMSVYKANVLIKRIRRYNKEWSFKKYKGCISSLDIEPVYNDYFKQELIDYGFIEDKATINSLIKEFLEEKEIRHFKKQTIQSYVYTFDKYFDVFKNKSNLDLNEVFSRETMKEFINKVNNAKTKYNTYLSDRRKNKIFNTCYNLAKYAKENKYIDDFTYKMVASYTFAPSIGRQNKIFDSSKLIDNNNIVKFLNTFDQLDQQYKITFQIAFTTGLRFGELLGLEWQDINFKDHLLNVRRQINEQGEIDTLKTKSSEASIPINNALYEELLKLYEILKPDLNEFITYLNNPKKPISRTSLRRIMNKHIEIANIPRFKMHDIRHTFGSNIYARKEENIAIASMLLRHSSIRTTEDIYLHSPEEVLRRGINDLNNVADSIIKKRVN